MGGRILGLREKAAGQGRGGPGLLGPTRGGEHHHEIHDSCQGLQLGRIYYH